MNYWLVKSEPETYSWETFAVRKIDQWDGVRNYQARNHLRLMKLGDLVLFYHSVSEKAVVGIARVAAEAYPEPQHEQWTAIKLEALEKLLKPVSLQQIKQEPLLQNIALLKQSRLSVMPLTADEFDWIIKMGNTLETIV